MKGYCGSVGLACMGIFLMVVAVPSYAGTNPTTLGSAQVFFVDADNGAAADGTSWATAFPTVQAGIDAAQAAGGEVEVWVAEGTYAEARANDTGSVVLKPGVAVYGGFAGNEVDRELRDWEAHVTTIDGATARAGQPAYHVVIGADNATLDGFTITGGNADGGNWDVRAGAGMFNWSVSPTVTNCVFTSNSASNSGGAMYNLMSASPTLAGCTFEDNNGGALVNDTNSSPTITACQFLDNTGTIWGAMQNYAKSSPTVTGCTFSGNSAANGCGAVSNDSSSPVFDGCTFTANTGLSGVCGAVGNHGGSPAYTDCNFADNAGTYAGAMLNWGASKPTISGCTFTGNRSEYHGGAISNGEDTSGATLRCTFQQNVATYSGGAISNGQSSPEIRDCVFVENTAGGVGGAICSDGNAAGACAPLIANCRLLNNHAGDWGGAIGGFGGTPTLTNCLIASNSALSISAVGNSGGTTALVNCTVASNVAQSGTAVIWANTESTITLVNSIVFGNTPAGLTVGAGGVLTATYCDIQGGYAGTGNLNADPIFVDPAAGDFRLVETSPCVNAGTGDGAPASDITGTARVAGVDMGAYESVWVDTDGDGMPDTWELHFGLNPTGNDATADSDGDGLSNLAEYKTLCNPGLSDTDGDGLSDGEEVTTYGTDPARADSDGDGVGDGLEVHTYGTDPLAADAVVAYKGESGELPQAYDARWVFTDQNNPTSTVGVSDGILACSSAVSNRASWLAQFSHGSGVSLNSGAFMETTARILSEEHRIVGGVPADRGALLVGLAEASGETGNGVALYSWQDRIFVNDNSDTTVCEYLMDTTDAPHTYRVELLDRYFVVYVDGVLRMNGTSPQTANALEMLSFKFGDSSSYSGSVTEWTTVSCGALARNPSIDDTDGDDLTDADELTTRGTNPLLADTDGDSINDGLEINTYGTNPLEPDTVLGYNAASGLLPQHYDPRWVFSDQNNPASTASVSDGVLTFESALTNRANWQALISHGSGVSPNSGVFVETSVHVVSESHTSNTRGIHLAYVGESNGTTIHQLDLFGWQDRIFVVDGANVRVAEYAMDTTNAFHIYRVELLDRYFAIYVDGTLRISGTTPPEADTSPEHLTLAFGDWTVSSGSVTERTTVSAGVLSTDPNAADTDGDGLTDGAEVDVHGTNPLIADTDGDGLSDGDEINVYRTDPARLDTDGDGAPDGYEVVQSTDPLDGASVPGGLQTKYSLGPAAELLDASFYAGEAVDGSNAAGRFAAFGRATSDGKTVVFWATNIATSKHALFRVELGDPTGWQRLGPDWSGWGEFCLTPDNQYVFTKGHRISLATGEDYYRNDILGYRYETGVDTSRRADGNWLVTFAPPDLATGDLLLLPILPDGSGDISRQPRQITNMKPQGNMAYWPAIRPDGGMVAFNAVYSPARSDGDVYALGNLQAMVEGSTDPGTIISELAPTSFADPALTPVRTFQTTHCAAYPSFSEDGRLLVFSEDSSGVVNFSTGAAAVTPATNWDVMVSEVDGSGETYQLAMPGNQAYATPTPGGTRVLYVQDVDTVWHLMIAPLDVAQEVTGTPAGGNALLTTADQTASDASGTTVFVPAGTTVVFPPDAPQAIQITTPTDPALPSELPPGTNAIPVLRQFGPEGTQFDPAIQVTIAYTDAEVAGFDEARLRVFLYNPVTGKFVDRVSTITARDLDNNTITFSVSHFSIYGLGFGAPYDFAGFLPPIGGADASGGSASAPVRTFRLGSTVPVKFTASDTGIPILAGVHTLQVTQYSAATSNVGTAIDAKPTDSATTGNQFRLTDDGTWQFNLSTKALGPGVWLMTATLSDGSQHTAWIALRK